MKIKYYLIVLLLSFIFLQSCTEDDCVTPLPKKEQITLHIGLIKLTDDKSSDLIPSVTHAIDFGIADALSYFETTDIKLSIIQHFIYDSLNPQSVIDQIALLKENSNKTKLFCGFIMDNTLEALEPISLQDSLFILSVGNSSLNSAKSNDFIYRYTSNDAQQIKVAVEMLKYSNIKRIITVNNSFPQNQLYAEELFKTATYNDISLSAGIKYSTTNFDKYQVLEQIREQIVQSLELYKSNEIALFFATNEETEFIIELMKENIFSTVKYFVSENTMNSLNISNQTVADYALKCNFISFSNGTDKRNNSKYELLKKRLQSKYPGVLLTPTAAAAYDAVFNMIKTAVSSGTVNNIRKFTKQFEIESNNYYGVTGWTALDAYGDKKNSVVELKQFILDNNIFIWKNISTYYSNTNEFIND